MILKTFTWYQKEIERVQQLIDNTDSEYLKRDSQKYLKRLKKDARRVKAGAAK